MDPAAKRGPRVIRIDIGPRTVLWTLVTIASAWLFIQLWPVLIVLAVALMIVGTLRPIMSALERRGIPRGLGLLLIFVVSAVVLALLLFLTIPSLIDQLGSMVGDSSRYNVVAAFPSLHAGFPIACLLVALAYGLPRWILVVQATQMLGIFFGDGDVYNAFHVRLLMLESVPNAVLHKRLKHHRR